MATYQVYRIAETSLPLDHQAIFVETHKQGPQSGDLYHVTGTVQNGMVFEHRPSTDPNTLILLSGKRRIGTVAESDYPQRFIETCEKVPPPKKQFDKGRALYPDEPVRRCGEWVDETIVMLNHVGILDLIDD